MDDMDRIRSELAKQGKADSIRELASSREAKHLGKLVDKAQLEAAVKSGDEARLREIMRSVLSTAEGKALVEKLSRQL